MGTIDSWSSIETIIRQRLESNENERRYCAVCGRQGPQLSRCFGCQMVYYCGEEHQIADWSNEHAQKCTQLEWVALGEFIQALPAQPPLPSLGDKWPLSIKEINNWKSWFSIRANIVNLANNTANVLKNLVHITDKRQLTHQNAVDGLLAAVTELLTHVLSIGKALVCFGLQPNVHPLVIHILSGFNKTDLVGNNQPLPNLPARFHELLNMFPDNKGVELVIVIGDDDQDDTDYSSLPQTKLKPDRLIITTTGKGRLLDTSAEKRLQRPIADLLVYFNAAHLFSPLNKDLLKSMLMRQRPTLLTFEDQDEFNQAQRCLSTKGVNIQQAGTNQFSSLIIRQRSERPNSTYSTNSYQILFNSMRVNSTAERNDENSLLSRQRSHQSSIGIQHGHVQQQQQLNPGLKQVNGKIHIESLASSSSTSSMSHNTQANNNGTLLDTSVHIVSTANTAPTVQPLVRSNNNNNTRQPTIVQRRHQSPPRVQSPSPATTVPISHRAANPTTAEMMTAAEIIRSDHRPQPKPRLSLVKTTTEKDSSGPLQHTNGSIVQRIKPYFEQSTLPPQQEPNVNKLHRQSLSIPYTYQIRNSTKSTCLDDIIPSKTVYITSSSLSSSTETNANERTVANGHIVSSLSRVEQPSNERTTTTNKVDHVQITKSTVERTSDEQTKKIITNSVSSSLAKPIEIHHDQRNVLSASTVTSSSSSSSPSSSSSSSTSSKRNRADERIVTATMVNIIPTETHIDQTTALPMTKSNLLPLSSSSSSTNHEIIYTEVIKSRERTTPSHQMDLTKSPISPSRSFIIPTKSPSISSKNSSFQIQRPSRPLATPTPTPSNHFTTYTNKPKPLQSSAITSDRISLYSQRSTRPSESGVTIKNLSECIDRVGIVFDDTNRRNDQSSSGITAVDLIREQLTNSTLPKSNGSLLDKLYKSNSSTRLSASSTRPSTNNTSTPRSKSQQAPRTHDEQSASPKISSTSSQPTRRAVGVFLPLTPKTTNESEQGSLLVYQNLEPRSSIPSAQPSDYTLKQLSGPVCMGIPKPFRKPTAIIEPSPVITSPMKNISEPNYINLNHQTEHIYTNENGMSNSNSYTSKTSSIYSTSDKQHLATNPDAHYAMTHLSLPSQEQSVEYDSFDDELVVDDMAKIEKSAHSNDNTDNDSFDDDDDNQIPTKINPSKNSSSIGFIRSTLNRLTRSNKSLERLNNDSGVNEYLNETNPSNIIDTKTKKTLRSIKARHEAKKTGHLLTAPYTGDEDTTSIDSNCSTQTATSLNKTNKSSHNRFRLFRRKTEKEFASDTEAEKHHTEQRRKKWSKKMFNETNKNELKTKRLLMMSDDDDDVDNHHDKHDDAHKNNLDNSINDETHIYDHIINDETNNSTNTNSSRVGKLSHETHLKPPTITLDEIRSEIQAEIAARQDIQQINIQSNLNLQKKRSKSVTFLDELLSDDSKQQQQQSSKLLIKNEVQTKSSSTAKRIEKGDARSICGALTGTGPIRGIIKAANNEITGTTAPISPSAAAAIYLGGPSIEPRCTSPKSHERPQRPLTTYTVGSARFYDGTPGGSTNPAPPPPLPPPPPIHSMNQHNANINNSSNQRPILNNSSSHSTSNNNGHHKRPTAKVSPFQTKSPSDTSSSLASNNKQTPISSIAKKPLRSSTQRNTPISNDTIHAGTSSVSDGVGAVSKRLQSNF